MNNTPQETELAAAYKSLESADRQIKNLLIERKQNQMIISLLEMGGYITDGKLEEARELVQSFHS